MTASGGQSSICDYVGRLYELYFAKNIDLCRRRMSKCYLQQKETRFRRYLAYNLADICIGVEYRVLLNRCSVKQSLSINWYKSNAYEDSTAMYMWSADKSSRELKLF